MTITVDIFDPKTASAVFDAIARQISTLARHFGDAEIALCVNGRRGWEPLNDSANAKAVDIIARNVLQKLAAIDTESGPGNPLLTKEQIDAAIGMFLRMDRGDRYEVPQEVFVMFGFLLAAVKAYRNAATPILNPMAEFKPDPDWIESLLLRFGLEGINSRDDYTPEWAASKNLPMTCDRCSLPFDRTGRTKYVSPELAEDSAGRIPRNTKCPRFIGYEERWTCQGVYISPEGEPNAERR